MSMDDWFRRFWRRRSFFFPDIERMVEDMEREISEMFKEMERMIPRDMVREFQMPDGTIRREYGPFVYGYSMKIGPDGRPIIREFGNIKPSFGVEGRPPLNLQEQREPLVDIIDEAERIRVIAELPGVEKEDINLYATPRTLTISVDTPQRKYYKELELPVEVDESSAKSTYKNGILEVIFNKKKERKMGTQIKVE